MRGNNDENRGGRGSGRGRRSKRESKDEDDDDLQFGVYFNLVPKRFLD